MPFAVAFADPDHVTQLDVVVAEVPLVCPVDAQPPNGLAVVFPVPLAHTRGVMENGKAVLLSVPMSEAGHGAVRVDGRRIQFQMCGAVPEYEPPATSWSPTETRVMVVSDSIRSAIVVRLPVPDRWERNAETKTGEASWRGTDGWSSFGFMVDLAPPDYVGTSDWGLFPEQPGRHSIAYGDTYAMVAGAPYRIICWAKTLGNAPGTELFMQGAAEACRGAIAVSTEAAPLTADERTQKVSEIIKQRLGEVRYCYASARRASSDATGELRMTWRLEGGIPRDVAVVSDATGVPGLADCVTAEINRWLFDPILDGNAAYAFQFAPID